MSQSDWSHLTERQREAMRSASLGETDEKKTRRNKMRQSDWSHLTTRQREAMSSTSLGETDRKQTNKKEYKMKKVNEIIEIIEINREKILKQIENSAELILETGNMYGKHYINIKISGTYTYISLEMTEVGSKVTVCLEGDSRKAKMEGDKDFKPTELYRKVVLHNNYEREYACDDLNGIMNYIFYHTGHTIETEDELYNFNIDTKNSFERRKEV